MTPRKIRRIRRRIKKVYKRLPKPVKRIIKIHARTLMPIQPKDLKRVKTSAAFKENS
jgi:hypothetical protein